MARGKKSLKILFVADPLDRFDPVAETSLYLMREAQRRGHQIFCTEPKDLSARGTQVLAQAHRLKVLGKGKKDWYRIVSTKRLEVKSFDAVLLRKDPPFNMPYLHHLYLLEIISDEVYMMNHPSGVIIGNEKLLPLPFLAKTPDTLVSARRDELLKFIEGQKQGAILKPLSEAGGRGIFWVPRGKANNLNVILETMTQGYTRHVVAQTYLPEARRGDKRILLIGEEILGAFVRIPAQGEHRANLHAGGVAKPTQLTSKDLELVGLLRPVLGRLGLDFVGLDIIAGSLIEVNVTSPMGIHEINQTSRARCERKVLNYLEERAF